MTRTLKDMLDGKPLEWWQYCKLFSAFGLLFLAGLSFGTVPGLVGRVLLHFALDFALQEAETAENKATSFKHLLKHSLAVGGLPFIFSASIESMLVGIAIGIVTHLLIDSTDKLGVANYKLGALLDQMAHLILLAVV